MAAGRPREAGYLSPHGDWIEARIQRSSNGAAQRANLPDSRLQYWVLKVDHQQARASPADLPQRLLHSRLQTSKWPENPGETLICLGNLLICITIFLPNL
jgi:hypothetical protein